MQPRPVPLDIPDRRPYVRLVVENGPSVTLRLPDLTEHVTTAGRVQRALAGVVSVVERIKANINEMGFPEESELDAAHQRLAAAYGVAILRTWSDPDMELETRIAVDAARIEGKPYAAACGLDGWEGIGLDAYRELLSAGWSPGHISAIASELVRQSTAWLNDGKVADEVKRKAKDFPGTN